MSNSKKYETIVIYDSVLTDQQITEQIESFKRFLEENGASDVFIDQWGKREFAFQLKSKNYGNYVVYYFKTESLELGNKINSNLRINEGVLKFQTHRIADRVRKFKGRQSGEDHRALVAKRAASRAA